MTSTTWEPATVKEVARIFRDAPFRWWISGGHALELHLGRSWRPHEDADVGICRADAPAVFQWLREFDLWVAAAGRLRRWQGQPLRQEDHENNVWVRRSPEEPWLLDLSVGEGNDERWVYRRDLKVFRPWHEAVLRTPTGVPYLSPDLQLLFKSKAVRPKDDLDARLVIPSLDAQQREFLDDHLPPMHQWRDLLAAPSRS